MENESYVPQWKMGFVLGKNIKRSQNVCSKIILQLKESRNMQSYFVFDTFLKNLKDLQDQVYYEKISLYEGERKLKDMQHQMGKQLFTTVFEVFDRTRPKSWGHRI